MPDDSLLMLFDEVRGKTLRVLRGVSQRQALWRPPGLQNNILWHAAHCWVVVESLTMRAIGKRPRMRDGWFEMFSWKAQPAEIPAKRWPSLDEVVARLQTQRRRLRPLLAELSQGQLASAVPRKPEHSVRYFIVHALHDEACHAGEIWLLRKIQQADRAHSTPSGRLAP